MTTTNAEKPDQREKKKQKNIHSAWDFYTEVGYN